MKKTPLKRSRPKRKKTIPKETRMEVKARTGFVCAKPGCTERVVHLHHILPENMFPSLATEVDNLVGLCAGDHFGHESAMRRLPKECLPEGVWDLARKEGPAAVSYLERTYE